jgi:acyl-CoA synthetase (AMP-forming)/AMP-acid ligase II
VRIESDNSYRSGTRSTAESCHSEEIGQILVTGSHVVKSYLGGSGDFETKTKIDGEIWHKTGDAGYFDEEGRLWLVGRYDRALSDKHGTLFPFQLEAAALKLPGVKRAAAVQFAGRRILVLQPENRLQLLFRARHLSQEALQRLLWARLDQVITVGVLPVDKRHNSKIDYPALISLLSSRRSLQRPNASTASASFCGSKIG